MTPPALGRRSATAVRAAVVAAAVVGLSGCGSGNGSSRDLTPSAPPATPTTSRPESPESPESPSSPGTDPTSAAATPPTSASSPGSRPPAPALAVCADLAVTVTRVPGAAGVTYGLVSVRNRSSTPCALPGVPSLRLLDAARSPVTATAAPVGTGGAATRIDPGGVASTLLADRSDSCQANTRSTYVEVTATTAAAPVVAALSLPPCALSVRPFTPGTQPEP